MDFLEIVLFTQESRHRTRATLTTEQHGALCQPRLCAWLAGPSTALAGTDGVPGPTDLGLSPSCFTRSGDVPCKPTLIPASHSEGEGCCGTQPWILHTVGIVLVAVPLISRHAQGWGSAVKPYGRGPQQGGRKGYRFS